MQNNFNKAITESVKNCVKLFTRDDSPYYYCAIKKPDTSRWVQRSTKTMDKDEALLVAYDMFSEMRVLHKQGYSSIPTKFSHACDLYIVGMDKELALNAQ